MKAEEFVERMNASFDDGFLSASRKIQETAENMKYGYGNGYNEGHDHALCAVVDAINELIAKRQP